MTSPLVDRKTAMAKPTHHQFIFGFGYLAHSGPPALTEHHKGTKNTAPPARTKDGSLHRLQPPGSGAVMVMHWVEIERAWASTQPQKGNRLAWTTGHLMRAGWEYIGPAR